MRLPVKGHCSYLGTTGYNYHSRGFFRALRDIYPELLIRNFTTCDLADTYLTDCDRSMIVEQTYRDSAGCLCDEKLLSTPDRRSVHIVLNTVGHHQFYDEYDGPKIAYVVWETTRFPDDFFARLLKFDQLWVPSQWQRESAIEQGYPADRVFVVPEGIDPDVLAIEPTPLPFTDRFRFVVVGRWEHRKGTINILRTFLNAFKKEEPADLILCADNPFAKDKFKDTEARLAGYGLADPRIVVKHFMPRAEYLELLRTSHVFVSCARGEGWNIPLVEAIALGVPAIFSNYGAQLEYGSEFPLRVKVRGERRASSSVEFRGVPGHWCEPDWNDLGFIMRTAYENYEELKQDAIARAAAFRTSFDWKVAARRAAEAVSTLSEAPTLFVTGGNQQYFPIIEKLVKSLKLFSKHPVAVYGVNADFKSEFGNAVARRIDCLVEQPSDRWYWKQHICLQALREFPGFRFIWIDGDSVANKNIDELDRYFDGLENYPISERHLLDEYYTFKFDEAGRITWQTAFNEQLCELTEIPRRRGPLAHACLYLFDCRSGWWFRAILELYDRLKEQGKSDVLWWNDEGIDNLLRWKHGFTKLLPVVSNFETGFNPDLVFEFFSREGPYDFNQPNGWNFIPADKSTILYFHGNKDPNRAEAILQLIQGTRPGEASFWLPDGQVEDFSRIQMSGTALEVAEKNGWYAAMYFEVFHLRDYTRHENVTVAAGDIVVDIGANIGMFSRLARANGAAKIYAFEPDPRYFECLQKNSHPDDDLFCCAIADRNQVVQLNQSRHFGGSTLSECRETIGSVQVDCFNLDHFFAAELFDRIDFLKVDTEGAEHEIFAGLSDANLLRVRKIAIEYHNCFWGNDTAKRERFVRRFTQLGFNCYTLFMGQNENLQMLYLWK